MRVALKIAYVGTNLHGSQVQPNVETVEGEMFKALKELGIIDDPRSARFISAGRTDSGVHALGQVVAFNTGKPNLAIPRVINSRLPGCIWAWAHALVPEDFDPRRDAVSRSYRYVMSGEQYDISKIRSASRHLKGTHDFANFCTRDAKRGTVRNVQRIDVRVSGNLTKIDVKADSFLWNMVRKMVAALMAVGSGVRDSQWLENMLDPQSYEEGIESAPSYGLILRKVEYRRPIEWVEDSYSIKRAYEYMYEDMLRHRVMAEVLDNLISHP